MELEGQHRTERMEGHQERRAEPKKVLSGGGEGGLLLGKGPGGPAGRVHSLVNTSKPSQCRAVDTGPGPVLRSLWNLRKPVHG